MSARDRARGALLGLGAALAPAQLEHLGPPLPRVHAAAERLAVDLDE